MQLLERAPQLKILSFALQQAKSGQGCVALVYGEAGIGKTSLIEQFIQEQEKDWRTLSGACDSLFTPRPLGSLHDIALQISSAQGTGGRLLDLLDSESNREAIFSACLNELKEQRTILVIEDIHWADEATLDLLKYLGRRIRQTNSLMILTYRDDEVGVDHPLRTLLGDLASSHAVHRVQVSALSRDAVHELAKNKNVDVIALHRLTNGNPFFVTEVLAVESGIPETVRDAVLARAAKLSRPARTALEAAAVIGSRAEPGLLSSIADADSNKIQECVSKGMLQAQGDYYAFRHELARQTIYESIPSQRKALLHRKILDVLQESPVTRENLSQLAHHAQALNDSQAVLEFAPLAAWWASELGAHREAATLYELALQFARTLPPAEHARLLETYVRELDYTDRSREQILVLEKITELWRSVGDRLRMGVNLAELGTSLVNAKRVAEAEEVSQRAIALLEDFPPGIELAQAYMWRCYIKMMLRDVDETIFWGEKALVLGERFKESEIVSRTCNYMGCVVLGVDRKRGMELFERSLAVAREANLSFAVAGALGNLGGMLLEDREIKLALRYLAEAIAYAADHDDDYHLFESQVWQGLAYLHQGHWTEAMNLARAVLERSSNNVTRTGALFVVARLGLRRGDSDAKLFVDEALSLAIAVDSPRHNSPRLLQAEAFWLRGEHEHVLADSRQAYETAVQKQRPWIAGELAFWRWRAGEDTPPPSWIAAPFALQISGDWRNAAQKWDERGCPYEQGMALMDGDEAAQLAALEIFEKLGARPIMEKLKQKMRTEGARVPRGPRPGTRENPFGLTVREMEVLECLVQGLSNNAIAKQLSLSIRTVEHHIAAILQKMEVPSRNQAVAKALKENLFSAG